MGNAITGAAVKLDCGGRLAAVDGRYFEDKIAEMGASAG